MAGDRRATMGNIIAQRDIEKVFPADEYSAVGIAGSAGLAVELVRLFQTELEHYEKIEGSTLSLDGKANRLAALIRGNLGMAMQGLAVVPLFAGYDLDAGQGRIFSYDVTGGRYEETAFYSVGSGSLFAKGSLKKLYREDLGETDCATVVLQALYDAADDDSATGGPDLTRRIFPVIRVITAEGGRRLADDDVAEIADRVIAGRMNRPDGPTAPLNGSRHMSMPFYVSPEQLMKDRADFARKGIARGRSVVLVQYADGILLVSENPSQALHKVSEIYDRIAFAAVGRYNEFENLRIAGVRLADMRGYAYDRRDVTGRGLANAYAQTLGTIFSSGGEKPYEVEIFVAEVGDSAADDQVYRLTYQGQVTDEHGYAVMGGEVEPVEQYLSEHYTEGAALDEALRLAVAALGHAETEDRVIPTATSRWRFWTAPAASRGSSCACRRHGSTGCSASAVRSPRTSRPTRTTGLTTRRSPRCWTTPRTRPTRRAATCRPWRTPPRVSPPSRPLRHRPAAPRTRATPRATRLAVWSPTTRDPADFVWLVTKRQQTASPGGDPQAARCVVSRDRAPRILSAMLDGES